MKDFTFQPPAPKVVTPENIYNKTTTFLENAVKGWNVVDFRYPRVGERFLDIGSMLITTGLYGTYEYPRLILEPLPKRKVFTFTETGEAERLLGHGECGVRTGDGIVTAIQVTDALGSCYEYKPCTLVESEV